MTGVQALFSRGTLHLQVYGRRRRRLHARGLHLGLILWLFCPAFAAYAVEHPQSEQRKHKLRITVVDENGVPIPAAQLTFTRSPGDASVRNETDYAGRSEFLSFEPGSWKIKAEKEGFYTLEVDQLLAAESAILELTLNHEREFSEVMDVASSPPIIDRGKTVASDGLSGQDILNLPYPTTRDVRNAFPFIPGVIQDTTGQLHVNGSSSDQILNQLDGFNMSHPVNGALELRISADAVRAVEVQGSRYPVESGKGSGGVLQLTTAMGDDRLRFSGTNFIPSVQNRKGWSLDNWSPRANLSGPLIKKRAWFFEAADVEYNLDIVEELPPRADRNDSWRVSNLAKAQVNLNQTNILTAGLLLNRFHSGHIGLSRFDPLETTLGFTESAYLITLKEQSYLSNGMLLEIGLGSSRFTTDERPLGVLPYIIRPGATSGNFFREVESVARRTQFIASLTLPSLERKGRHELKTGAEVNLVSYDKATQRRPISILREDGTLSRRITFFPTNFFEKTNLELAAYLQDRWSLSDRTLMELGLRVDRDQLVRRTVFSPRLAFTYLLTSDGNTKIAAGIGLFHDAGSLDFITRPLAGRRVDIFFDEDGETLAREPSEILFEADEQSLRLPRFLNWSWGLERKLPKLMHLRVDFVQKRGSLGYTFVPRTADLFQALTVFELQNFRRDRYDSLQVSLGKKFKDGYSLFAAYTRSSARSNAVVDFSIDNPIFSRQAGGPLPWDAPNRMISWGSLPLLKRFDFAYSLDWRTGFPFTLFNRDQQIVGRPNERRLPAFFSLNTHIERKLGLFGALWSLRVGFNNVTNRANPSGINSNVDSPQFMTLGGTQSRAFVGRIRFLGRK